MAMAEKFRVDTLPDKDSVKPRKVANSSILKINIHRDIWYT